MLGVDMNRTFFPLVVVVSLLLSRILASAYRVVRWFEDSPLASRPPSPRRDEWRLCGYFDSVVISRY